MRNASQESGSRTAKTMGSSVNRLRLVASQICPIQNINMGHMPHNISGEA